MERDPADVVCLESGRVRVLDRMCSSCIFRPGARAGLTSERFEEVVSGNLEAEALLTCHSTLPYGAYPEYSPAVCAGFWERHRRDVLAGRIAELFMGVVRVPPPGE